MSFSKQEQKQPEGVSNLQDPAGASVPPALMSEDLHQKTLKGKISGNSKYQNKK